MWNWNKMSWNWTVRGLTLGHPVTSSPDFIWQIMKLLYLFLFKEKCNLSLFYLQIAVTAVIITRIVSPQHKTSQTVYLVYLVAKVIFSGRVKITNPTGELSPLFFPQIQKPFSSLPYRKWSKQSLKIQFCSEQTWYKLTSWTRFSFFNFETNNLNKWMEFKNDWS